MSNLADARKNLPNLSNLDDGQFIDAMHKMYYPDMDKAQLSAKLGYVPPAPPVEQAGLVRTAGDVGIKLAQGVVDVGSSVVGLGSLATGGLVGKGARAVGYDPKGTNEFLGQYLSDSQKASDAKVAAADGFVDTVAASLQNPRSILGSVAESAPGMLAGMGVTSAVARGIATKAALATGEGAAASAAQIAAGKTAAEATKAALTTQAGAKAAGSAIEAAGTKLIGIGAATEGAQSAGQIADNAQADGREYLDYALPAVAAGVGTAAIGLGAGKLMGDAATEIATGARSAGVHGGMLKRLGKEALSEGVLEEMPQSAQEQYFTNIAMGEQDRMKGVGNAAGAGLVTGAAMGGGMGALQGNHATPETPAIDALPPVNTPAPLPNTGPLSQAANAGQAATQAAAPAPQPLAPEQMPLDAIDTRMAELLEIGRGMAAKREKDQNDIMVTIPSVPGRPYTPDEQTEFKALAKAREARVAIPPEQLEAYRALQSEEAADHTRRLQAAQDDATAMLPSTPNELVDAVPERKEPAPVPVATNTAAVDAAIAAGMRLKTPNGAVLQKPGSTKIFKLSSAQKAHYDATMKQAQDQAEQQEELVRRQAQQQTEREAAERDRQAMDVTNAIVEKDRVARAAANRAALRAQVLGDATIPAQNKADAYKAALKRDGYIHATLTQDDHDAIAAAGKGQPALNAAEPVATPAAALERPAAPASAKDAAAHSAPAVAPSVAPAAPHVDTVVAPPSAATGAASEDKDDLLISATEFVRTTGNASIPKLQRQLRIGYNRAARLLETMQQGGIVSAMAPDGARTVIAGATDLDTAAHAAATSPLNDAAPPTAAQKEAGNYKKAHVRLHGLDIAIENPVASKRSGTDPAGVPWETEMQHHYGYIKGTVGMDKDHIDTFIGQNQGSDKVFVVDQVDPATGKPDEHKVMLGFDSAEQAHAAYQSNYASGWKGGKQITETSIDGFKAWLDSGNTKKPFAAPSDTAVATPVDAPAPIDAAPQMTAQQLNRMTVKDMSDDQLRQAHIALAGGPRANKIGSELSKRGIAPAIVDAQQVAAPPALVQADKVVAEQDKADDLAPAPAQSASAIPELPEVGQKAAAAAPLAAPVAENGEVSTLPALAAPGSEAGAPALTPRQVQAAKARAGEERRNAPARELGLDVGDTITLSRPISYMSADKPMTVEAIQGGQVHITSPDGRTAEPLARLLAEHRRAPLITVQKAAPQPAAAPVAPAVSAPPAGRKDVVYKGKGATIIDNEKLMREWLTAPKIDDTHIGKDMASMFEQAHLKQAQATFDQDGNFIGQKYRAVPARSGSSSVYMFDDLGEAKSHADTYGQRSDTTPKPARKVVGKGENGQNIFEDAEGIRSYRESGHTWKEDEFAPVVKGQPRERHFKTIKELAAPATPAPAVTPVVAAQAAPTAAVTPADAVKPAHGAGNKLFTAERAAKARALLKSKIGTPYGGIDPELLMAGIELAGFHIEAGARIFSAYAKAMIADIGEGVRPFLRSYYEGVRHYPGHDNAGMTPASEIDAQMAQLPAAPEGSAPVAALGTQPKAQRKTKPDGSATLTHDFGIEHIDGYASNAQHPIEHGDTPTGGIKRAFLNDAKHYLNSVATSLKDMGFAPVQDAKGKPGQAVRINEAGPAVSGDVHLALFNPALERGVFVNIAGSALRGIVPNTASGVAVMMRVTTQKDSTGGDHNRWMQTDLSAQELAEEINQTVKSVAEREKSVTIGTKPTLQGQKDDGPSDTGRDSPETLGRVVAEQDGGPGAAPRIDGGERDGRAAGDRLDRAAGDAGLPRARSARSGAEPLHPADAGAAASGRLAGNRAGRTGSAVSGHDAGARDAVTASTPATTLPAQNFIITDDLRLGQGGEVVKFNDNLAAIRTMRAIEADNRRATPAEQAILARYVGWGGLANAFPAPESGQFKDAWAKRGPELAELLTPKEYALARRSTLDAHYTSKSVVDSMWQAARRLGYRGGLALESSMGAGGFIGLMPRDLASNTKFIGVEYDNLTARIAALLYPQETVLNSGFQNVPLADGAFDLSIGNPPFGDQSLRFQFKPELNGHSIHNQFFLASMDAVKPGGLQIQVVSRYLLDKQDKSSRMMLAGKARLLGAIRLPDTAFKENARTSVVTDVLYLQRLTPDEETHMSAVFAAANQKPSKDRVEEAKRQALLADIPEWVGISTVADPLGGDVMPVNNYFASNPQMILGTMERSGSMSFHNDITVRPDHQDALPAQLARAIARLPENVMVQAPDVIEASKARHQAMSDALHIALAGHENGSIKLEPTGEMAQIVERETPEGDYELTRRVLSPASPWSDRLMQNSSGQWYTVEAVVDAHGKPVKAMAGDIATKKNVYDRKVFASEADIPNSMLLGELRYGRLKQMVGLRDLLKNQLTMESANAAVDAIEDNRAALAGAYTAFVDKHGLISEPSNSVMLSGMPDGALVQALEFGFRPKITAERAARIGEKARPASAAPAPILSKRVIVPYEAPTSAASTADALAITLAESGRVDLARIAALLGKTVPQVEEEMAGAARPMLFHDPESGQWETRSDYLTGQVKRKLNAARVAGLSKNVAALEEVQPEAWGAESVTALLGSAWVPPEVYADFIAHITGNPAVVTYSAITNAYNVLATTTTKSNEEEWSSTGYTAAGLVADLLNSSAIRVNTKDAKGAIQVHREFTDLALLKARAITNEFADWVYKDGARRARLVDIFNEKFNTRVARQHDGSHLVLPGKVPDAVIGMRRHQKNAIWRGIAERFMLIDHAVGAGKTFTAIARAMERRRMGLSKKPVIAVPNHMVEQFASDVYRLYPGAKVLAAGKKDFEKSRRRKLFAKIATGDFDIVIMPHSSFGFIGIAPETEERYLEQELVLAQQAISDAQDEADESGQASGRSKPFGVKEAERLVEKITMRMDKVKGDKNRDRLLTFEQMGIDDLTVDEAHEFKNLFYSSRLTGVKGMGNKTGSHKAFDMYNKVRVLRESPTGTVTFMTGTPISNSAVEMYNMMRYLAAAELKEMGLENFDAWRAQFVSTDAGWEPTETGRLKEVNRLGRTWSNMRSLMDLYYSFTDSVDNDAIKAAYREDDGGAEFPIPAVKGGDRRSVVIQPTKAQIGVLDEVLAGFDQLPREVDPYERNKKRLRLMDRARKVSLDVRAADPGNRSAEVGGKLDVIADEVTRLYQKWHEDRGTQLVFLDRSVPKAKGDDAILKEYDALVAAQAKAFAAGDEAEQRRTGERLERFDGDEMTALRGAQAGGWNAYQQIKDNLVARGVPAAEIAFIQEANNDAQKKALFDAVNDGTIRVLIGSTPRMGAGTNVQKRLVGLHHADVTWKPSDIEQREGRIIRQGNMLLEKYGMGNFEVEIMAYATERTIDAKMWSLNASKLKTINAIRKYSGAFTMEFEDQESVSMAELAALASGDPLLLERVKLMSEIDKLELLKRQHARKSWGITSQIEDAQSDIANLPAHIDAAQVDLNTLASGIAAMAADAATRSVLVEGAQYRDGSAARAAVFAAVKSQQDGDDKKKVSVAINGRRLQSMEGAMDAVGAAMGDVTPFVMTIDGDHLVSRTGAARAAAAIAADVSATLGPRESQTVDLGTFMGLPLEATMEQSGDAGYVTTLAVRRADGTTLGSGDTNWRVNPDYTTSSMRTALDALEQALDPQRLEARIEKYDSRIASAKRALPELLARKGGGFAQQAELQAKNERLDQVIRELSQGVATPARAIVRRMDGLRREDGAYRRQSPRETLDFSRADSADYFRDTHDNFAQELPAVDVPREAGAEAPSVLRGKEMGQALKDVGELNRILADHGMDPVRALRAAPNQNFAMARQIGEALGIKVHYITGTTQFHGVAAKGVAYLAEGMPHPELAIAGHETMHAMEQMNPELGQSLRAQIRSYLRDGVVEQRMMQEGTLSKRTGEGEVLADINGAMWLDPVFWRDMAKADANLFRRAAYAFMQLATKAIGALRGGRFDVSQLVSDVEAVRAILVATWAAHAKGLTTAPTASTTAAYSLDGGNDAPVALDRQRNAGRQFAVAALQSGSRAAYDVLKAAGATQLNYYQWVVTKTPNFKHFYGDWEQAHGTDHISAGILDGVGKSQEPRGVRRSVETAAHGAPAFPGQSGPVRAAGGPIVGQVRGVSAQVEPVIYYHGSRADINAFDLAHPERKDTGWLGRGVYVTSDVDIAHQYASVKKGDDKPNITPLFVAVRNPYIATQAMKNMFSRASQADIQRATEKMISAGYDGVVLNIPGVGQELVAFDPAAVKSAVGNNGAFDAGSTDIRYSRAGQDDGGAAQAQAIAEHNFKRWFGGSKVVDDAGAPLVVYHGSGAGDIQAFRISADGSYGKGAYFASDPAMADHYADKGARRGGAATVYPVYLNIKRPLTLFDLMDRARWQNDVKSHGIAAAISRLRLAISDARADGVIIPAADGKDTVYVVFSPNQIKSAIGNNGDFDRANPAIAFSKSGIGEALQKATNDIAAVRLPANYLVGDLFNQSGKLSWWHKSIGTMDNLAKRKPLFARVYQAVQSFIGDVSRYAVVAADLAPTLLPQLENISDIFGAKRKKALSAADTKAIGAPIFEGTLTWARDAHGKPVKMSQLEEEAAALSIDQKAQVLLHKGVIDDGQNRAWRNNKLDFYESVINKRFNESQLKAGVVWSDAELRGMFNLADNQIGLYREFRAALDKSLTNLTISEMVKLGGKDAEGMLDQAIATGDVTAAGELLRDHFVELARMSPKKVTMHLDTAKQIMDVGDKGADLMARGYAPLTRFGKYTVYVQQDGEQVYFGMFESQAEASKMARDMVIEHPEASVEHGTVSAEGYKLFAGVSPETIELFGSMVGLDSQADGKSTEVYQSYLKLAKNNRSAMKRLIQRKGIAGFSEDAGRVLAGFIYSNARLTAGNAHLGKIDAAVTEIPKQEGELTDAAVQLRDFIKNPDGGGSKLGGLMFAQFLGGSVASAMVNLTQPVTMTLPYLSQFGGLAKASAEIVAAVRDAGKTSTGDAGLDAAMEWATQEGIVAPQEVHYLQAQAAGKAALRSGDGTKAGNARAMLNNTKSKVMVGWGKLFAMAELTNRRVTFIAAYRTAVRQGMVDPARFAQESVTQTQGVYNPGNKPKWARGAIGGLAMTFKQYSIGYVELLSRMANAGEPGSKERAAGRRGALYMLAVLFLMAGADGLPFEQDLEDAIDGILQRLGYNFSSKRKKQEFLTDVLGSGAADFVTKGMSSLPGMPIDVAGRFGMGNLIPSTGLLTKKDSYTRDIAELAGPAGDLAKRAFTATGKALGGDIAGAALELSPVSVRNLAKAADMAGTGEYRDARGYNINAVSPMEALMKGIGFQPNSTANIQDAKGQALNMISQTRMRSSEIQERWAQGIFSGNEAMVRSARDARNDWNLKNPEAPISVNMPALQKRVRAMRQDAVQRTQATAPKALKQTVRSELREVRG